VTGENGMRCKHLATCTDLVHRALTRSELVNENNPCGVEAVEHMSQIGRPCKQCGNPIDKPQGRRCRKCYNRYYSDTRQGQIATVAVKYRRPPPYDCRCGAIECDTCGDRMLQSLLDKRPAQPVEERSWVGIPQFA
jgi:hypothetical protein